MKLLYVLVRDSSLFGLPLFRKLRNFIYERHLNAMGVNVGSRVRVQKLHSNPAGNCKIGAELHVSSDCLIDLSGNVLIGDRVTLSEGAKIFTHTHQIDGIGQDWRKGELTFSSLSIGDDVWIGANAIILHSVTHIGAGAVIAAGSVVRSDVEAGSVVVGVPGKPIRTRIIK